MWVAAICLALLLFASVLLVRGLRFVPRETVSLPGEEIPIDEARAVEHLQGMLRCRTVSAPEERDEGEFVKFRALLPEYYPRTFAVCETERVDSTGLLLRWPGKSPKDPAVLLAHYDVVPAGEEGWAHPPFAGVLEDGVLWGRGALDMKNQLCGVLEGMEHLISTGFVPARDVYFALSGEEEIMGPTASSIRDLFRQRGITPAFVLDEGGDVMDGILPGTDVTCAMVGVGEKGVANLWFTAKSAGGHASVPTGDNPLPRLCRAMTRIGTFPQRSTLALEAMVDALGRYTPFPTRVLLANRDLLRPLYFRYLRRVGGMMEAASRTTFALTMASGSAQGNMIPAKGEMFANLRLLWGDTTDSVVEELHRRIGDPGVEIRRVACTDPRPDSRMTRGWPELCRAIHATWPQAVVTPYPMVACTDSRHWRDICDNVYRFSAKAVTGAEKATVHGVGERIRTENTGNAARFFVRLLEQC